MPQSINRLKKKQQFSCQKSVASSFDKTDWSGALLKWHEHGSPFRPSRGDIENYSIVLDRLEKKKKVLLLGSTPEIREILSELESQIIIVDLFSKMLSGMLNFGPRIIEAKEKWIRADWMELDEFLKNNYFDVILGDLVLRNIDPDLQLRFFGKISRLLKKNGYFVSRIHFLNEDLATLSAGKIIRAAFRDCHDIKNKLLEDLITSRLFDNNTDFETKKIDKKKFAADIHRYITRGLRDKKEKLILNNILKKWVGQRTWTQRIAREVDQLLLKYFIIRDMRIAVDYKDSAFYPLYVLRNNKSQK